MQRDHNIHPKVTPVKIDAQPSVAPAAPLTPREQVIRGVLLLERAQNEMLPPSHPLTVEFQKVATLLRAALCADPLHRLLGLTLPAEVSAELLVSDNPNAWVYPNNPQVITGTTGLRNHLKTVEQLAALLAHEQGHQAAEQLRKRNELQSSPITERNGEPLWIDPRVTAAKTQLPVGASKLLSMKKEEQWCDGPGAMWVLNRLGISPQAVVEMLRALSGEAHATRNTVYSATLEQLTASHPADAERLMLARAWIARLSLPSTFVKLNRSSPSAAEQDNFTAAVVAAVPRARTEELVSLLIDHSNFPAAKLTTAVYNNGGGNQLWIGYPEALTADPRAFIRTALRNYLALGLPGRLQLFQQFAEAEGRHSAELHSIHAYLGVVRESGETQGRKVVQIGKDIVNSHKRILGTYGHDDLSQVEQRISGWWNHTQIGIVPAQEYQSLQGLLTAPATAICNPVSPSEMLSLYIERLQHGISLLQVRPGGRGLVLLEPQTVRLMNAAAWYQTQRAEMALSFKGFEMGEAIYSRVLQLTRETDLDQLLGSLIKVQLREELEGIPGGPYFSPLSVTAIALRACLQLRTPEWLISEGFGQLRKMGFSDQPYNSSGEKVVLGHLFNIQLGRHVTELGSLFYNNPAILAAAREHFPRMTDLIIAKFKRPSTALLCLNSEMDLGVVSTKSEHDRWAVGYSSSRSPDLHPELTRGKDSITEYLSRLAGLPHLFTAKTWERITSSFAHDLSECLALARFVLSDLASDPSDNLVNREAHRVFGAMRILEHALERFPIRDLPALDLVTELLVGIPRFPRRNSAVQQVLEAVELVNPVDKKERARSLLQMIETEPFESMADELMAEIDHRADPLLRRVEEFLSRAEIVYCSLETFETVLKLETKTFETDDLSSERRKEKLLKILRRLKPVPSAHAYLPVIAASSYDGIKGAFLDSSLPEAAGWGLTLFTPTMLRYAALQHLQSTGVPAPQDVFTFETKSLRAAQAACKSAMRILEIDQPTFTVAGPGNGAAANSTLPDHPTSASALIEFFDNQLLPLHPAPTKDRDAAIISNLEKFSASGGKLRPLDLQYLAQFTLMPETQMQIGKLWWDTVKDGLVVNSKAEAHSLIDSLEVHLPYHSTERNSVLKELRRLLNPCDHLLARRLNVLEYVPGLVPEKPHQVQLLGNSMLDLQVEILRTLEPFDVVEFVLYSMGMIQQRPWSCEYIERSIGGTLGDVTKLNREMSASQREAFLHAIFGGRTGILAGKDTTAKELLANRIAEQLSLSLGNSERNKDCIKELSHWFFVKGQFPVAYQTALLVILAEWSANIGQHATIDDHQLATLVQAPFMAAGSGGVRLLQQVISEPGLLPEAVKSILSGVQDSVAEGAATLPFHMSQCEGSEVELGARRGGGSMAEVYQLLTLNGTPVGEQVVKTLRIDGVQKLQALTEPLIGAAVILTKHGFGWGELTVRACLDSCIQETRLMGRECALTGSAIASILARALDGEMHAENGVVIVRFKLGSTERSFAIPTANPLSPNPPERRAEWAGVSFAFQMRDLGQEMVTISKARRIADDEQVSIATVLSRYGVDASELAEQVIVTFFAALLRQNTRLGDLQPGNVGVNTLGQAGLAAIFDFGTTETESSPYWTNWMLRSLGCAITADSEGLKLAMLEVAAATPGCVLSEEQHKKLRDFVDALCGIAKEVAASAAAGQSGISSIASLAGPLGSVVEFLFNGWPLPRPVRDLCESIRRTIRNWSPMLDLKAQESVKEQLLQFAFERTALGGEGFTPSAELARAAAALVPQSAFEIEDPAFHYNQIAGQDLDPGKVIPSGAIVWMIDSDEKWVKLTLTKDWKVGDSLLSCGGRIIILNSSVGLVGFREQDRTAIFRFESLIRPPSEIADPPPSGLGKAKRKSK